MMRNILKAYSLPITAIAAYIFIATLWHGRNYAAALWAYLEEPQWWAENTFSVVLFTALAGVVVNITARRRQELDRAPYVEWKVKVKDGEEEAIATLDWQEVRRFQNSPLEERRFIQSVLSARGETLKSRKLDLIRDTEWADKNWKKREYLIDLNTFRKSEDRGPVR